MSMQDKVADLFTRIRNGQTVRKRSVNMFGSKYIESILNVLKEDGYIEDFEKKVILNNKVLFSINLKYYKQDPVIKNIKRISKPSFRIYCKHKNLPIVLNGLGIAIMSTSKGVMSSTKAREFNLGGEIIGFVE